MTERSGMVGRQYTERGSPVRVLARWAQTPAVAVPAVIWLWGPKRNAPRNVVIERADGSRDIRPFRGLRRMTGETDGSE